MKNAETNNDGRVDVGEMVAFFESREKTMVYAEFKEYLGEVENRARAAYSKIIRERVAKIMSLVDTDDSNTIDQDEIIEWVAFGDAQDADVARFLKEVDRDGDGKIALAELQIYIHGKSHTMKFGEFTEYLEKLENRAGVFSRVPPLAPHAVTAILSLSPCCLCSLSMPFMSCMISHEAVTQYLVLELITDVVLRN